MLKTFLLCISTAKNLLVSGHETEVAMVLVRPAAAFYPFIRKTEILNIYVIAKEYPLTDLIQYLPKHSVNFIIQYSKQKIWTYNPFPESAYPNIYRPTSLLILLTSLMTTQQWRLWLKIPYWLKWASRL